MNEVTAGIGWGLAGGLAVALGVSLVALIALWKRTKQPDTSPADEGRKDVTDFTGFGGRRANG